MDCGYSAAFNAFAEKPEFPELMRQFQAMQFSQYEIRRLYNIFHQADMDGSGSIALAELLTHIDMERTAFTVKIFSIFDDDKSGEIDFKEFVMSLWNYCTLTKSTLDMFAFDLYDKDCSGELSGGEVARMLRDIYGKDEAKRNFNAINVAKDLKAIEDSGKLLNLREFSDFVKTRQALLFPAFQMQTALRRKILGERFWEANASRRIRFTNGKYIPHTDPEHVSPVSQLGGVKNKIIFHVHEEVHELVEATGTRAVRKKSLEGKKIREEYDDTSHANSEFVLALHDSAKNSLSAKLARIFRTSSKGSGAPTASTKVVSTKVTSAKVTSAKVHPTIHTDSALGISTSNISSKSSQAAPSPLAKHAPAPSSVMGGDLHSPFLSPRGGIHEAVKREGRRGSKDGVDPVPSGILENPSLTVRAAKKIEQFSAIEAWHNQPEPVAGAAVAGGKGGGANAATPHARDYAVVEPFDAQGAPEPKGSPAQSLSHKRRRSVGTALNLGTLKYADGARASAVKRRGSFG